MSSDLMLMLWDSFVETVIMVGLSGFIGSVFGIPLGILLHVTDNGGVHPMPIFNKVLGWIINAVRSTPFIILLVAIIPLTRVIAGTSIGTAAAVVPLTIAVAPFIARLVETSLREVDKGLIEAAQAMGATNLQIVMKVLLPEAMPGIVAGLTISLVSLVGYSAMAGAIGGGGLAAGVSTLAKLLNPNVKVIGVEPTGAASMRASLEAGWATWAFATVISASCPT